MSIVPTDLPLRSAPSRRRFLQVSGLTAATAMLAVACSSDDDTASTGTGSDGSSSGEKLTDITVQMSWLCDAEFSPVYIADKNGYFADEGVKVELIPGGPDIGAIESIVGVGGADIGVATDIFSIIAANADGSDFVAVGSLYQSNLNGFISPKDAPIETVADLAGKKIGGAQGVQPKLDAIFALNDMEPDYTFVPAGFGPDLVINGDVDTQAVFITDEVIAYREETGEEPVMLTWEDIGLPSFTLVFFCTKDYLENNRDAVKGFLAAIQKGQVENEADPELGAKLAVEDYGKDAGLDIENEKKKNVEYLKYADSDATAANGYLYIDPAYVTSDVIPGMEAAKFAVVPVDEAVDMSLLEEIKAGQ